MFVNFHLKNFMLLKRYLLKKLVLEKFTLLKDFGLMIFCYTLQGFMLLEYFDFTKLV